MKLNLLPQTEKKSRQGRAAIVVGLLIVLVSIGGAAMLTFIPKTSLEAAKASIGSLPNDVARVDAKAKSADVIIAHATDVIRNSKLAQAMIDHNDVYPKLYDDVKRYIPPYYRLQQISAVPAGPGVSTVTMVGTLNGYQKYADLMLALYRFKDAVTIERSGYSLNAPVVPSLTQSDQKGKMRKVDEAPIPDDGLERLAYFQTQASAAPKGYLGVGSFGSGTTDTRGALPNDSVVTIVMTVARDLRVPLASETLRSGGAASVGGAAGGFGSGVPGAPGAAMGPSGPPGGGRSGAGVD